MDVFETFAVDVGKETDGVWHDIGDKARLLVARSGNRKYARMLSREVQKHQRVLDVPGDAADEASDKIMIKVLANTILLNWECIQFKKHSMPYSVENAEILLAVKDFRSLVNKLSSDFEAYHLKQEEAQGNS